MAQACRRCGSEKLVPNVPLMDHYGDWGAGADSARVSVAGKPDAWFFKDSATGRLTANICGECGLVELEASNFHTLYEKYIQARGEATAAVDESPPVPVAEDACLSCGQIIPPGESRCPACGWSWESPQGGAT